MLNENDIVSAVAQKLTQAGYVILGSCMTTERGVDLSARHPVSGKQWLIEAKGQTSSMLGTSRHGKGFNANQVATHVAMAMLKACQLRQEYRENSLVQVALALPDDNPHRNRIASIRTAIKDLGLGIFWVSEDGEVHLEEHQRSAYSQKLQDARWQQLRLQVFQRDGWRCQNPGCDQGENRMLAVHHKSYVRGRDPWDYPLENFITYCVACHERLHSSGKTGGTPVEGSIYSWQELPALLGFKPHGYLTQNQGTTLCGCFRLDYNPDAPEIVLPGTDLEIVAKAENFVKQKDFVPVFIKSTDAGWEYCGRYRVSEVVRSETAIGQYATAAKARGADVSMVLVLEKELSP